ncbi:hypothetical protein BVRB_1g008480 [Beta vulgaris subsp. vulgaris]|nr:hypothetical protein BVRB_1g008480 [Beta vulgaris subsp. vulgaris]
MDVEAWRPHPPWTGNPMAGNKQEAGAYYASHSEHPLTCPKEGRVSWGSKPRTFRGRFARSSYGASCNAEVSGCSRAGKRKVTGDDTTWLTLIGYHMAYVPVFAYPRMAYYGWLRYLDIIESYMPYRTLRQLGFIQEVPHQILESESCYRPSEGDRYRADFSFIAQRQLWDLFPCASQLMLGALKKAPYPSMATDASMQWYHTYSHPYIINPIELPDG